MLSLLAIIGILLLIGGSIHAFLHPSIITTNNKLLAGSAHEIQNPTLLSKPIQSAEIDDNAKDENFDKSSYSQQRRMLLSTVSAVATSAFFSSSATDDLTAEAFSLPFGEPRKTSLDIIANRANSTSATAMRQPTKEGFYDKEIAAESCLLELLPTKSKEFRTLERCILSVSDLRQEEGRGSPNEEDFKQVAIKLIEGLQYLDDQRSKLAPVFNQDDSTLLAIEKATRGESCLENLRYEILTLLIAVQKKNAAASLQRQRETLRALSEVGELLVESFPYEVPTEGKFSFLPRLLGRAKITFLVTRPATKTRFGGGGKDEILGNVTILADGFAAPITAGNFVDLSARGFYTGLPVKVMKKRLGANPTLTFAEDDIVAYDIASTVDKLAGEDGIVQKAFGNMMKKKDQGSDEEEDTSESVLTTMPIMGSFNEGFFDPLTAKPRRVPLEVVQFDRAFGRAKLSYESGFSTAISSPTSSSKLMSVINPVVERTTKTPTLLTFDIPGLVAMNHPDKNLNGGSSEFFVLTKKDLKPERSSLLNGKYAPFGYVIEGLDIMNNLQANDMVSATYVDEWGKLNLKRIRGTSFADAISQSEEDE